MYNLMIVTTAGESAWKGADVRQRLVVGNKVALLVPASQIDYAECVDCLALGVVSKMDGTVKGIELLISEALEAGGYGEEKPAPKKAKAKKKAAAPQHDWENMKVSALREYAKERNVANYKKLKKAELVAVLSGA